MKNPSPLIGAIAAAILGWVLYQANNPAPGGSAGFPNIPGFQLPSQFPFPAGNAPAQPYTNINPAESIRIGSFNIQDFGESKIRRPEVMDILARVGRQFDILAVQEIQSKQYDILPLFLQQLNADGSRFDYVIGPRVGRGPQKEQYAFVFDTRSIEVDRHALYTIDDPQDLISREPLIGWFRVRGPPPEQAFTFSLVNIHTDPDVAVQEVQALEQVFRAVRNDGRNEDDVIILGDYNCNYRNMGALMRLPGAVSIITGQATMVRGRSSNDNMVFALPATNEFTGRGGVFDFLRQYNLSEEQALLVSDHLPIWAEFSIFEGGRPGQVATQTLPSYPQPVFPPVHQNPYNYYR